MKDIEIKKEASEKEAKRTKELFAEKYRPLNLSEFENLEEEKIKVLNFVKNYEEIRKKGLYACIIYGPTGTGKTALVYAIANQLKLELIELNTSDLRDKESIKRVVGEAIKQKSLFEKGKLILVDELEGISGQEDKGGLQELKRLLMSSSYPIILITSDPYDKRFVELRKNSLLIEIKPLDSERIVRILKRIAKKEGISINEDALRLIGVNARGDVRAAINDLQTLGEKNKKVLLAEVSDYLQLASRDKEQKIFDTLRLLFNSTILNEGIFENLDMEHSELIRWIDENVAKEYEGEALTRAYEMLSLADLFLHRIIKWQYWRFLAYVNTFLAAIGPYANASNIHASHTSHRRKKFVKYSYPSFFIQLYKKKISEERELAEILSKSLHCSTYKIRKEMQFMKKFL